MNIGLNCLDLDCDLQTSLVSHTNSPSICLPPPVEKEQLPMKNHTRVRMLRDEARGDGQRPGSYHAELARPTFHTKVR